MTGVTFHGFKEFIPRLLSAFKLKCLIQGNITKSETQQLVTKIESMLNFEPIYPAQLPEKRMVKLKKGNSYFYRAKVPNLHDVNSCVWNEYQIGASGIKVDTMLELVRYFLAGKIFIESFF